MTFFLIHGEETLPRTAISSAYLVPYECGAVLDINIHQPPQPFGKSCTPFDMDQERDESRAFETCDPRDYVFTELPSDRHPRSLAPDHAQKYFGFGSVIHNSTSPSGWPPVRIEGRSVSSALF